MTTIYRKTAKGQEEIATRAHRLPPRLRGALILIDGQRTAADLAKLVPGDVAGTLQQLLADGFIDVFAVLADRPSIPHAPTVPAPLIPDVDLGADSVAGLVTAAPSIEKIKREAAHFLIDRMGPVAESLAMKIERTKSAADLQTLLVQALPLLRDIGGAALADAFQLRFIGRPPTG
jgi:hypothetical protein